ncbi:MAG: hypothetical protein AAGG50_08100 [Bacteroidota bacterium]
MPTWSFQTMSHWLSSLASKLPPASAHTHFHTCPRCERTTPWQVNALRGEYRCLRCGENPLDA